MVTWVSSRNTRLAWALFALLALSLALPGVAVYRHALATVCDGAECLPGQVTTADISIAHATGYAPRQYADNVLIFNLIAFVYCLLIAALFVWRKPAHGAAVAGAFALTAVATNALATATVTAYPSLRPTAHLISFAGLSAVLPFLTALPDDHFDPTWLQWTAVTVVPVAALIT